MNVQLCYASDSLGQSLNNYGLTYNNMPVPGGGLPGTEHIYAI